MDDDSPSRASAPTTSTSTSPTRMPVRLPCPMAFPLVVFPGVPIAQLLALLGFPRLPIWREFPLRQSRRGGEVRLIMGTLRIDPASTPPSGDWAVVVPFGPVTVRLKFEL
jgi:hypothetical protein